MAGEDMALADQGDIPHKCQHINPGEEEGKGNRALLCWRWLGAGRLPAHGR